ncbi:OmpA family protein [Marinifilum caeruleilacunae]|jgi:outer membrane protein OmpA-like peptidoglycan-associated protein|uniref:OmpA family protein n=1 Tax=Marinifilum caeruleilacunae TaxID=2499076 RepID=A0ABX1WSK4_9BACT|nr:OmpA family protein [Marinifilum caeruleilacunae]NOU58898.1 OmpA family protein [Marinifilum caeruleilacunae]
MKSKFILIPLLFSCFYSIAQELPTNPKPGKCYVKCITKDVFEEIEETVEISPAYTKLEIVPAVYKTVTERVLVKEASKKLVYVPAVYETIEVAYTKKTKRTDLEVIPASFGKSSETIEVYPKTSGWEYTEMEDCPSVNKEDCVIACFVEYPAQHTTVPTITLSKDASTRNIPIKEEHSTYKKQVIKEPARMEEVEIPAEYAMIEKQVLVSPASTKKVEVPSKMKTIKRTVLVEKGGISSWEEIECDLLQPNLLPIYYELGSARLTPDSKKTIDKILLPILNEKPVKIEIMAHTDSRGNDDYNMALSQQRANAVVNYLVTQGIERNRLTAKGYGETRLINRCANGVDCSEEEHQKNRRTEFRIVNQ